MIDDARRFAWELERTLSEEPPLPEIVAPRIDLGWDGLYPSPGQIYAQLVVERSQGFPTGGIYAKVYGRSALDAVRRLRDQLLGEPEPVDAS
jgi:hypothetical protein